MNLKNLTPKELLQLQASIISELQFRGIVRTQNNPLGDYTEWLVAKALQLDLVRNSEAGYDATDQNGSRIQIKGRRIINKNRPAQLSSIRNYDKKDFDTLAAVIFDDNYGIMHAVLIPHAVVGEYASYRKHVNAHILLVRGPLLSDPRVICIKSKLVQV